MKRVFKRRWYIHTPQICQQSQWYKICKYLNLFYAEVKTKQNKTKQNKSKLYLEVLLTPWRNIYIYLRHWTHDQVAGLNLTSVLRPTMFFSEILGLPYQTRFYSSHIKKCTIMTMESNPNAMKRDRHPGFGLDFYIILFAVDHSFRHSR